MATIIQGDIFQSDVNIAIAHQVNCVTRGAKGIARKIFLHHPYSNVYEETTRQCGNIEIRGDLSKGQRVIIAMFAQYYPGKPCPKDTYEERKEWFEECLEAISELRSDYDIAFPWCIGCGLAGGEWKDYHQMIDIFASSYKKKVYIYQFNE